MLDSGRDNKSSRVQSYGLRRQNDKFHSLVLSFAACAVFSLDCASLTLCFFPFFFFLILSETASGDFLIRVCILFLAACTAAFAAPLGVSTAENDMDVETT